MIVLLFMDYEINGSKRWIKLLSFSFQPSEFIKPFFLMVSAWFLSKGIHGQKISLYIVFVSFLILASLLILQPDFGMTVLFAITFFCQLFIAGLSIILISIAIVMLILLSVFSYFFFDHVRRRIDIFLDPSIDNYQISKSLSAFKSGGLLGKGPGQGILKENIPDAHTDFIFAVAGEELGFIVCSLIVILFLIIIIRNLLIVFKIQQPYIIIAIVGLTSCFGLQALINICSSLNIIPTKGMTLPLISYGGSSLVSSAILVGFLLSLTKKQN
jgi:cell division protein FtsW